MSGDRFNRNGKATTTPQLGQPSPDLVGMDFLGIDILFIIPLLVSCPAWRTCRDKGLYFQITQPTSLCVLGFLVVESG